MQAGLPPRCCTRSLAEEWDRPVVCLKRLELKRWFHLECEVWLICLLPLKVCYEKQLCLLCVSHIVFHSCFYVLYGCGKMFPTLVQCCFIALFCIFDMFAHNRKKKKFKKKHHRHLLGSFGLMWSVLDYWPHVEQGRRTLHMLRLSNSLLCGHMITRLTTQTAKLRRCV